MGSVNSVAEAKRQEDPSTNQGDEKASKILVEDQRDGKASKTLVEDERDGEDSKTLNEDLNETGEEEEEEEGEECMLCRYIKGGECKDEFIALEKCAEESEENGQESDVTKCKEMRVKFKTCMYDNAVYYEPILAGEARAIANMLMEMHRENEAILAGEAADIAKAVSRLHTEETPVLPAEAAAIAKAFQELQAEQKEKYETERSKGNKVEQKEEEAEEFKGNEAEEEEGDGSKESDHQNQN